MSEDDCTYLVMQYDHGKAKLIETANGKHIVNIRNIELCYENATNPIIRLEIVPQECTLIIK